MSNFITSEIRERFPTDVYFKAGPGYYPLRDISGFDLTRYPPSKRIETVQSAPSYPSYNIGFRNAPSVTIRQLKETLIEVVILKLRQDFTP